jgi:hypothetical protein
MSAMPISTEAAELGEHVEDGGERSPRDAASLETGLWRKTVVGGDRGRVSRGKRGWSG